MLPDWQGKLEALKVAVAVCTEHEAKFIRSVFLVKFFDALMVLLEDSNQKIQIEALQSIKTEMRSPFKVCFLHQEPAREVAIAAGRVSLQASSEQQLPHQTAGCQLPH
jgi:hypothetical protein